MKESFPEMQKEFNLIHLWRMQYVRDLLKEVLKDEESQDGGWGPDITMVGKIQDAYDGLNQVIERLG